VCICRGIDCYLPAFFGKIHPRWKTPHISILNSRRDLSCDSGCLSQINATVIGAYQFVRHGSDPLLHTISLHVRRSDQGSRIVPTAEPMIKTVLVLEARSASGLPAPSASLITLGSMVLAAIPPGGENKILFEGKLVGCTAGFVGFGLRCYWRGARTKAARMRRLA